MSGQEMNEATNTYKYNGPAYAIIFWSQEQVTVIKLDMLYPGVDISCTFINSLFKVEGKDQDGDYWSICTHNYCI
ncbi:MAG: hypothetical protein ABJF04_09360 [Reichenbachiella sp.]|uniref:hypothetical protein n=1 Tax=Reichenbachiella sp. TaxID=2184521 RepID=UPI003263265C